MPARTRTPRQEDEGFTLIELLVVIIIIGILAAIAIPTFLNQRQKGYDAQAKSDAKNLATLQETNLTDKGIYVVAADLPAAKLAFTDYKASTNVTGVVMKNYAVGSAAAVATPEAGGYCIAVTSTSTKTFVYDSTKGGLQPGTVTAC